jgi:hypothetical protein
MSNARTVEQAINDIKALNALLLEVTVTVAITPKLINFDD